MSGKVTSKVGEHRVTILVAITGFAGAAIPVLVASLSNQIANVPRVDIQFTPYGDNGYNQGTEITLANGGGAPATNLTLIVDAPGKIGNISYVLRTIEVDTVEVNNTRAEMHIEKLVHGSGSIVILNLSLAENQTSDEYSAFATYDQGSNARKTFLDRDELFRDLYDGYLLFAELVLTPAGLTFYIIFTVILFYILWRSRRRRLQRSFERLAANRIIEGIKYVRRELEGNIKSRKQFTEYGIFWTGKYLDEEVWFDNRIQITQIMNYKDAQYSRHDKIVDSKIIKRNDIRDYVILDDFYAKLEERQVRLDNEATKEISQEELEKLNKDLLRLANNAWQNIHWEKYAS